MARRSSFLFRRYLLRGYRSLQPETLAVAPKEWGFGSCGNIVCTNASGSLSAPARMKKLAESQGDVGRTYTPGQRSFVAVEATAFSMPSHYKKMLRRVAQAFRSIGPFVERLA